ncbi:Ppx/GppA phosphatase family protein [Litorimonas sp. RW-G-Af-16]|uniref:Ppx/GppA phosphatase family protein n=1 Tax=Litorimonas sp. RW-G-Af-16 TaxID=3241168 RepID=UPI003AAC20A7
MPDQNPSGSDQASANSAAPRRRSRKRGSNRGKRSNTFAALDLGTNNCRLLIARQTGDTFKIIDSYSKVIRLGQGLAATGRLSDEAMEATIEAVRVCSRKMKAKQVKRWRCVATEACRKASNGEEFLQRVKDTSGITFDIISARVEARLAVMGCLNLIDPTKDVALVVDIGGGSTELSWVDIRKLREDESAHRVHRPPIAAWASLPIGVVTLSEQVPEREDREAWYAEMKDFVRQTIKEEGCETRFTKAFENGKGHLIGTSGTITSLAGIHLKLPFYQRNKVDGLWLRSIDAVAVARKMAALSPAERAKEPCIGEDRATLLVAGCAITDVLCEMWPSKMIRVADRGLREGMLIGLMNAGQKVQQLAPTEADDIVIEAAGEGVDHGETA